MKLISTVSMLTLSVSLAIFSNNAMAAKTATAGITDLSYTLLDLDASDGISPTIQFYDMTGQSSVSLSVSVDGESTNGSASRTVHSWKNFQSSASSDDGSSKVGSGMMGNVLFANGNMADTTYGVISADQRLSGSFVLSPHTKLVFTGTLAGSAISTGSGYSWMNSASSGTDITLSSQSGNSKVSAYGQAATSYYGSNEEYYESDFALSYVNRSAYNSYGQINIHNSISAQDYGNAFGPNVPAVPEPETYAMMLSGLAVLGAIARRRVASGQKVS